MELVQIKELSCSYYKSPYAVDLFSSINMANTSVKTNFMFGRPTYDIELDSINKIQLEWHLELFMDGNVLLRTSVNNKYRIIKSENNMSIESLIDMVDDLHTQLWTNTLAEIPSHTNYGATRDILALVYQYCPKEKEDLLALQLLIDPSL
jgi:hypothetical protein